MYPQVTAPQIFTYGASKPPSPRYDSSEEIVTPEGNPKLCNNPPIPVPNVQADKDSEPIFSYSPLLDPSDSSDDKYSKQRWHKKIHRNNRVKHVSTTLSINAQNL